jgi:hypothetical protein
MKPYKEPRLDTIETLDPYKPSLASRLNRAALHIRKLEAALTAIDAILTDEIKVRYGTSPNKTESEMAGNASVYQLLVVPRNIARAALEDKP